MASSSCGGGFGRAGWSDGSGGGGGCVFACEGRDDAVTLDAPPRRPPWVLGRWGLVVVVLALLSLGAGR